MAASLASTDLIEAEHAVAAAVAAADVVVPVGAGTHDEVGGPIPVGTQVRAPAGIVAYDPADLTITLGAGTTVAAAPFFSSPRSHAARITPCPSCWLTTADNA